MPLYSSYIQLPALWGLGLYYILRLKALNKVKQHLVSISSGKSYFVIIIYYCVYYVWCLLNPSLLRIEFSKESQGDFWVEESEDLALETNKKKQKKQKKQKKKKKKKEKKRKKKKKWKNEKKKKKKKRRKKRK